MKAVKYSFLSAVALGVLVALAPASRAQDNNKETVKPENPPAAQRQRRAGANQNQFKTVAEHLKLTEDQKTKLQPIFREEATKIRELRQDTNLKPEELREKIRTTHEEYLGKMKPTLTTEQYDQLKKMRQQAPGRGARGVRRGGDATPPAAPATPAAPADEKK